MYGKLVKATLRQVKDDDGNDITHIDQKLWNIEVYHRSLK